MTKSELAGHIAKEAEITKKAATSVIDAVVEAVHSELKKKDGSIRIADLGTFKISHRKARAGINPQTKKKIKIPATKVPTFSAAKALKDTVKGSKGK